MRQIALVAATTLASCGGGPEPAPGPGNPEGPSAAAVPSPDLPKGPPRLALEFRDRALAVLGRCFPSRRVLGIEATDLVWGLGAFHCVTQQQPAVGRTIFQAARV